MLLMKAALFIVLLVVFVELEGKPSGPYIVGFPLFIPLRFQLKSPELNNICYFITLFCLPLPASLNPDLLILKAIKVKFFIVKSENDCKEKHGTPIRLSLECLRENIELIRNVGREIRRTVTSALNRSSIGESPAIVGILL